MLRFIKQSVKGLNLKVMTTQHIYVLKPPLTTQGPKTSQPIYNTQVLALIRPVTLAKEFSRGWELKSYKGAGVQGLQDIIGLS